MITYSNIRRYFSSPTDSAPWTYLFYDANNTGCVTFSNASGTTNANNVSTNITFTNELCIEEADIRLRVQGVNGCVSTANITFDTLPCSNFVVSDIAYTAPLSFSVSASGGTAPYTYEWFYDNTVFTAGGSTNTQLVSFSVNNTPLPTSTDIVCKVTDNFGCSDTKVYTHNFCTATASNLVTSLSCLGTTGAAYNAMVFLNVTPCGGTTIDWLQGISFTNVPAGMTITHPYSSGNLAAPNNKIIIQTTNAVTNGTYYLTYRVKDSNGLWSSTGSLTVIVPICYEGVVVTPITAQNRTIQIGCDVVPGDIIEVDISDAVVPNTTVDWTSLVFTDSGTNQTATTLGEDNGYDDVITPNVTYSSANKIIYYEVPSVSGTDSFEWSISTSGSPSLVSNGIVYTILLECTDAPVADDDDACVICGETIEIDILANDDANGGVLNTNSVVLTSGPSNGTALLSLDGKITYTANFGFAGTDTITYTVNNNNNNPLTSNEATVTITVICAGEPANISVCN